MVDLNIDLPNGFLDEEVRCGYTVTRQMKEVWAIELDMLVKILSVCKKYGIKMFANGGTAIGAVRHAGFIPWDDDIDLELDRENYNKLCEIGPKEFTYPYFFQTEYTDPGSLRGHIQIRRTDTTGILKNEKNKRFFNQGIFVDIFPYDKIPDDTDDEICYRKKVDDLKYKAYKRNLNLNEYMQSTSFIKTCAKIVYFFICRPFEKSSIEYYQEMENVASSYNDKIVKRMSAVTLNPLSDRLARTCDTFDNAIYFDFEFIKIPVSDKYNTVLHHTYGNYMEFVKEQSCHGDVLFDTCKPYTEYIENNRK